MPNRLTTIITGQGDKGETSLASGTRIAKDSARVDAMGSVDELNSFIGLFLCSLEAQSNLFNLFRGIQNDLFDLGGELAMPEHTLLGEAHWKKLETAAEKLNEPLPPLENFILPGGSERVSRCHLVRSISRRAERQLVALARQESVNPHSRVYLNRLSDLCFIAARWLSRERGEQEVLWQPSSHAP